MPIRALSLLFVLFFSYAVVVQLSDPDPLRWMAIYGAAGVLSALTAAGRLGRRGRGAALIVALVAAAWAATLFKAAMQAHPWIDNEEAREFYGLTIVGGWMLATCCLGHRRWA